MVRTFLRLALALAPLAAASAPAAADLSCYAEEALLVAGDGQPGDRFGHSVALSGGTLLVGAPAHAGGDGAAYVFLRTAAGWVRQAKLVPAPTCSDCEFGVSVALSGDVAVIGAWNDTLGLGATQRGSAYVFRRSGGVWTQEAKLVAPGNDFGRFGSAVATDGQTAIVGAGEAGRVHVYRDGGAAWPHAATLQEPVAFFRRFGTSLALEGTTLLVGSPFDVSQSGEGRVYVLSGSGAGWSVTGVLEASGGAGSSFGASVAFSGSSALVGAPRDEGSDGAAYVFLNTASWSQQAKLFTPSSSHLYFGAQVALSGEVAAVATSFEAIGTTTFLGGDDLFVREGSSWSIASELGPGPLYSGTSGRAVDLEGDTLVSGTPLGAGFVVVRRQAPPVGTLECVCTAGPCGNNDPSAGCANSTGRGAAMAAQGDVLSGDVNLLVGDAPPNQLGILFQGDLPAAVPFGDGILCASQGLVRLTPSPVQIDPSGNLAFGPCFGDPSIPSLTGVVPGDTKRYQLWFRDPQGPCGSTFNLSSGLAITW